jgi:hypothetical protein
MVGWVFCGLTAVGLRLAATVGTGDRYAAFLCAAVRGLRLAAAFRVAGVLARVIAVLVGVAAAAALGVVAAATVLVVGDASGVDVVLLEPPQAASAAVARTAPARNAERVTPLRGGRGVRLCGMNVGITSSASRTKTSRQLATDNLAGGAQTVNRSDGRVTRLSRAANVAIKRPQPCEPFGKT